MSTLRSLFLAVAILASTSAPAAVPAKGTPLWFCQELEQAELKQHLSRCKDSDWAKTSGKAAAQAATVAEQQCLDIVMAGTAEKRLKYNRRNAEACHNAFAAYKKNSNAKSLHAAQTACTLAITGLRSQGGTCASPLDCVAGLVCVAQPEAATGQCTKPLKAGAACNDELQNNSALVWLLGLGRSPCGPGHSCVLAKDTLVCKAQDSAAPKVTTRPSHCSTLRECPESEACIDHKCVPVCGH